MSVGWFLLSAGNAVSLADFRKGHSSLCGQPQVLEAFASPPGTAGVRDGLVHVGLSQVAPGWWA